MYAHREESPLHQTAFATVLGLGEGPSAWGLPVFVVGEFLRVVTHLQILRPPSDLEDALAFLDGLLESPSLRLLSPGPRYWPILRSTLAQSGAAGNHVFDAQVAAVCLEQGATTILTEDTDFHRFSGITVMTLG